MATIINDGGGYRRLQVFVNGKRQTIHLGKIDANNAATFCTHVEKIVNAMASGGSIPNPTAKWLGALPDPMHEKLSRKGLVKPRSRSAMRLGAFLDSFLSAAVVKASTKTTYTQTKTSLVEYFGADKPLVDIQAIDGDKWRQWMRDEKKLAQPTISKRVKTARQAFKAACKWDLIQKNPFADVVAGSQKNTTRQFFVTRDMAKKVLDACPDIEWKLLFALSRFGGLRCPSEHLALRWIDVDWANNRIRVRSCKTEHMEGGDCRMIPLFPELYPLLMEAWEAAEPGAEYVITKHRDSNINLRTRLGRIIERAGLKQWPRLFHNLRATRQTELAEKYPIHVVCSWIGNSEAIAQEHYLQVTDAHFAQATAQNPARHTAKQQETGANKRSPKKQKSPEKPGCFAPLRSVVNLPVTPRGFEPLSPP